MGTMNLQFWGHHRIVGSPREIVIEYGRILRQKGFLPPNSRSRKQFVKMSEAFIRKPKLKEMKAVKVLIDGEAGNGAMLPRPIMELYETARDFYVYVEENEVLGCCALHIEMENLAEIRSIVVKSDQRGKNVGVKLLQACMDEADDLGIERVYALTRVPDFFLKHEFIEIDKHKLPHKVFNDCVRCPLFPDCDEVAMVHDLRPYNPSAFEIGQRSEDDAT